MPNAQDGGFQGNISFSSFQRPQFQSAYNASRGPFSQLVVAQSYPLLITMKLIKVTNDMERMLREMKESNERMMNTISEQYA